MSESMWLIRTETEPVFYIHEIRGAVYVSWVSAKNKNEALLFPSITISSWRDVLSEMTGFDLNIVRSDEA